MISFFYFILNIYTPYYYIFLEVKYDDNSKASVNTFVCENGRFAVVTSIFTFKAIIRKLYWSLSAILVLFHNIIGFK